MNRRVRLANLISGRGFVATSLLTVGFQLLTEPKLFGLSWPVTVAVLFFSQLGLYISLLGFQAIRAKSFIAFERILEGRLYWLRHRYDLATMSFAGFVSTLLAQSALNSLGHTASSDLAGALGGALVTHAVLLPMLAIALGLIQHASISRREIDKTWGQIELALTRDLGPSMQPFEPSFRAAAQRVVDKLQATKTRNANDLNERIQQFTSQAIQPIVRDLVSQPGVSSRRSLAKPKSPSFIALISEVTGLRLASSPEWAMMPALLLLPFYLEVHGWIFGLLYALLVAGAAFALGLTLRRLVPRLQKLTRWPALAISFGYFALLALFALVLELVAFRGAAFTLVPQLLVLMWAQQVLADIFGAAEAVQEKRDAAGQRLRSELAWLLADVNTREWFVRKLFMRNQPGLAKGELASQIFRLQESGQLSLTDKESESLVTQLEYRIKHLLTLPPHATDLRHDVDAAIESWRAKASIRYTMDFETAARLQQDPVATLALTEVIRELVGMAVHLAKASGVDASAIVISENELELTLNVHQDFLKPDEHFDSQTLASATRFVRECAHRFEYLPERTRAILKVRIPIRAAAR